MITPSKKEFIKLAKDGKTVPLYKEITFSSPQSLYVPFESKNTFLLESIKGPEKIARYSFIGFEPCLIIKIKNGIIEIERNSHSPPFTKEGKMMGLPPFQK